MSAFPLYSGHGFDGDTARDSKQFALLFSRGFGGYPEGFGRPDEEQKKGFLDRFYGNSSGDKDLLEQHAQRTRALVDSLGGLTVELKAIEPLFTGLGNSHPLENGMTWHPTLGVPYLSAAAVKGLTRAFLAEWCGDSPLRDRDESVFGISPLRAAARDVDPDDFSAGSVIFFDLIPVKPVTLVADVMTPHYADWYLAGATTPGSRATTPADWQDPTPVGLLAVERGAKFQLSIAPRPASGCDLALLRQLAQVTLDALNQLGIGAKTAVGYGRMHGELPPPPEPWGKNRLAQLQMLRKADRTIDRGGRFVQEIVQALNQLERFTPEECVPLVALFEETFKRYEWKRGKEAAKFERLEAFRRKASMQ